MSGNVIVHELGRAKPPNGQTLRALVAAGGIYTSPSRGAFDLIETFSSSAVVAGQDLPRMYADLVNKVKSRLQAVRLQLYVCVYQSHRSVGKKSKTL